MPFKDREQAGQRLAQVWSRREHGEPGDERPLVLALPRGGVPVGFELARVIGTPLEIIAVRKIGAPENPEFGVGAITEEGLYWLNPETLSALELNEDDLDVSIKLRASEVERMVQKFRRANPLPPLEGRTVLLVDDGLATGVTALVANIYLRHKGARRVILATPVAAAATVHALAERFDEIITVEKPENFFAVGHWYEDFSPVTDEEVVELLSQARERWPDPEVSIPAAGTILPGTLEVPSNAKGLIIFAHGSGSSRQSPRNVAVAVELQKRQFATLLFDLLTPPEARDRARVFDIPFLASRLVAATLWARDQPRSYRLPVGFFGASTGGGAALWAAADLGKQVSAIVSRGGRPDLAAPKLTKVTAPTLLIVGGFDHEVVALNELAAQEIRGSRVVIVPGASHLFEEPGTLDQVVREATRFFEQHLARPAARHRAA